MRTPTPTGAAVTGPLAGLVAGVVTAVPGVLLHQAWWGLALTVAATAACCVASCPGWSRMGYAVGWAASLGLLLGTRPEGDYLVPARLQGYLLMGTVLVLVMVALVTIPPPERVGQEPAEGDDQGSVGDPT